VFCGILRGYQTAQEQPGDGTFFQSRRGGLNLPRARVWFALWGTYYRWRAWINQHEEYSLWEAIQQPLPIYKQCTLQEIIILGSGILLISSLVFPLMTWLCCWSGMIGLALAFPLSFGFTRLAIGRLATLKQGKPHGFYQQTLRNRLARVGLYRLPYVTRVGRWSF